MTGAPLVKVVELHEPVPTTRVATAHPVYALATLFEYRPGAVTLYGPPFSVSMTPGTPPLSVPSATAALYMSKSELPVIAAHGTTTFVTLAPEMVPLPF